MNMKVKTSKGRFGEIISQGEDVSKVRIGHKVYDIANKELMFENLAKPIQVIYSDITTDFKEQKEIIYLEKGVLLFDRNNPLSNNIHDVDLDKLKKTFPEVVKPIIINIKLS